MMGNRDNRYIALSDNNIARFEAFHIAIVIYTFLKFQGNIIDFFLIHVNQVLKYIHIKCLIIL